MVFFNEIYHSSVSIQNASIPFETIHTCVNIIKWKICYYLMLQTLRIKMFFSFQVDIETNLTVQSAQGVPVWPFIVLGTFGFLTFAAVLTVVVMDSRYTLQRCLNLFFCKGNKDIYFVSQWLLFYKVYNSCSARLRRLIFSAKRLVYVYVI